MFRQFAIAFIATHSAACVALGGYIDVVELGEELSAFTFFGSKWEPGENSASFFDISTPPRSSGAATWSIMDAGHVDVSGIDSGHGANETEPITALGVDKFNFNQYKKLINWALDVWSSSSGFENLGYVKDGGGEAGASAEEGGAKGDIRVAAWELVSESALAHASQPGTEAIFPIGGTIAGDMHIDVKRQWVDDPSDVAGDESFDLGTVVLHEIGHTLGLGHSSVPGSVMEPVYDGGRRTLSDVDILAIQYIYGEGNGRRGRGKPQWAGQHANNRFSLDGAVSGSQSPARASLTVDLVSIPEPTGCLLLLIGILSLTMVGQKD